MRGYSYSQSTLNFLIEICFRASKAYFYSKRLKLFKNFFESDLSLNDAALDAIVPLFCKETEDQVLPIIKSFNSWQPPVQTETDAIYFLNSVIAGRVEQHISLVLKEKDPLFAKILESIKYLVKTHDCKKVSWLGKQYIIQSVHSEISQKPIDQDSFERLPGALFRNQKTLLEDIFTYLIEETNFFPAIPLNDLVMRLKELNLNELQQQTNLNSAAVKSDITEIVSAGLNQSLIKLNDSYYSTGKMDEHEFENFKKALYDMAEDLKDGGINRGLFDYLKPHSNGLNKEEYQDKYHNILEYLLKVMKNTIKAELAKE